MVQQENGLPHQSADWFAMTVVVVPFAGFLLHLQGSEGGNLTVGRGHDHADAPN